MGMESGKGPRDLFYAVGDRKGLSDNYSLKKDRVEKKRECRTE